MKKKRKNIVIVGASSSIGNEIILKFMSQSTFIIATYNSKKNIVRGSNIHQINLDLTKTKSIEYFIDKVHSTVSHIDTIIFLAGVLPGKSLKDYDITEMESVMTVNFTSQAKIIKGLIPLFDSNSHIIMMSSISAQRGSYDPIYSASKGATLSFVKSLANGLGGVRINAIAPGLIKNSTMYTEMSEERQKYHKSQTSSKQLLTISDLSDIIFDISKNHWRHLNGACIDINAGQYVR